MFRHHLKLVLRRLVKNKLDSAIGIGSFAIGITICLIIGLYVHHELTVDTCFENHEQIYRIINEERNQVYFDYSEKELLKESFPEISTICPVNLSTNWDRPVFTGERSFFMRGFITTDNSFFDMFSIPVVKSIGEKPFSSMNSVILTETTAKQFFGDDEPLGKQIILEGKKELVVSAIIKDFPENASINANILLNTENREIRASHCGDGNGGYYYVVNFYLQLNPEASSIALTKKINFSTKQLGLREEIIRLQALDDIYLGPRITGSSNRAGNVSMIAMFGAIGLLILILSVINHINFVLLNQMVRLKEIGVKKTTGANFSQLMQYYLVEVTVWLAFSLVFALLLVEMILPFANQLFNRSLTAANLFSVPIFISLGIFALLIVFISSLAPTYVISKFTIQNFISEQLGSLKKSSAKRVLTVFQFAIAIILLTGVITINKQIEYVKHKSIGFDEDHLLWLSLPTNYSHTQVLKNQLLENPAILKASISMGNPGNILHGTFGQDADGNSFPISRIDVDDNFLSTLNIELLQGRNFLSSDLGKSCLINETAYKKYGWKNFDGKKFDEFNVIGVVKDFHVSSLHQQLNGVSLVFNDSRQTSMTLRLRPENIGATMKFIENTWQALSPESPFKYQFYDAWFDAMYREEERLSQTIGLFSIIAFIITCLGLLSQSFRNCINRTKEIGIRKVLGASLSGIVFMLSKDFTKLALLANLIAWPLAWFAMKSWLENFAYRIELSLWPFLAAGLVTLLVTLVTVSWQAIRAAVANPVEALKYE